MVSETPDPVEEHRRLSRAWVEAEQNRVDVLQSVLELQIGKCTMDYPEGLFDEYDEALHQASQANRAYFLWLAEQGLRSR